MTDLVTFHCQGCGILTTGDESDHMLCDRCAAEARTREIVERVKPPHPETEADVFLRKFLEALGCTIVDATPPKTI